jgi:hypothetical protein
MKRTTPQNTTKAQDPIITENQRVSAKIRQWDPDRQVIPIESIESCEQCAAKLYRVLLNGHRIHRRNCDQFGFTWNGPLHSWVATLEKVYDLPVSRRWINIETEAGPLKATEYWFDPFVIEAVGDLFHREELAEATRRGREESLLKRTLKTTQTVTGIFSAYPKIASFHPEQMEAFRQLANDILSAIEGGDHDITH